MKEKIITEKRYINKENGISNNYEWNQAGLCYIIYVYNREGEYMGPVEIDPEDFPRVKQHVWKINKNSGRVTTRINGKEILLSRFILNAGENDKVRYSNRYPLDNRRCNLSTNLLTVIDYGISLINGLYNASIIINGEIMNLGNYTTVEEAKEIRDFTARCCKVDYKNNRTINCYVYDQLYV